MSQELINRQFQLERLSSEGKPLCEEIHRNNEEVLYQAEQEVDSQFAELRDSLTQIEEERQEPIKISRRQFILGSHRILEVWNQNVLDSQLQVLEIEKVLGAERANHVLNSRMEYFHQPDGSYTFHAIDKEPIGFHQPQKKIKATNAEVWAEKLRERQAKQNERASSGTKSD